jgi:hypothetical protein
MEFNPNKFVLTEMVKEFGLPLVLCTSFSRLLRIVKAPNAVISKYDDFKHKVITNYLAKNYKQIIKTEGFTNELIEKDCPIWVCWWQGYDNAPSIVKSCINSICRNAGEHPVIVVTEKNFAEYVSIPEFIINKLNSGLISKTHFSDILRASLLAQNGGVWIDSTCYMLNPFPDYIYEKSYYTLHGAFKAWPWTGFFQISGKSNIFMTNMRNAYFEYWSVHNQLITYLLIDCFMNVMYQNLPYAKKTIDDLPIEDFGVWNLTANLDKPYTKEKLDKIKQNTIISKLSYKEKHPDYIEGQETFWHYLNNCKQKL